MAYINATDLYEKDDRNPGTFTVHGSLEPITNEYDLGGVASWRNTKTDTLVTNNIHASNVEQTLNFGGATLDDVNNLRIQGGIYQNGVLVSLTPSTGQEFVTSSKWSNTGSDLFVTGSNVGIGTTAPQQTLDVFGTVKATAFAGDGSLLTGIVASKWSNVGCNLYVMGSNVGINTAAPGHALHIVGDTRIEGNLIVNGTQTILNTNVGTTEQLIITNDGTGPALVVNQTGEQPILEFQDDGVPVLKIIDGGNVGMGTMLPQQKLHVQGNILASGTITGTSFTGNASTATALQTARTINGTSFDGSSNITITANTPTTLTPSAYLTGSEFNGSNATTWTVDATDANVPGKIVARDVSGNFSAGIVTAALSGNASTASTLQTARTINGTSFNGSADITITANTPSTLTRGTYLTGADFNGSTGTTWAVDATDANTPSKIVARDASGNFTAGIVTAALSGNATTATTLQTARTINGKSFDGSSNVTITANTPTTLTRGTYLTGSDFNGSNATTWAVDATDANVPGTIVARNASGNLSAGTITATLSGNSSTATTLQTARTINGSSFNGSADITITANTPSTLSRGTYLTGTDFNGGTATTWAVDATNLNTPSKIVARDASGNLSAGIVTADLSGNATTANTLKTARNINGTAFNGSADITLTANTPTTLSRGTYLTGGDFNGGTATTWAVDATDVNIPSKIVARDASGNFSAGIVTAALTGNATSATTLQTARTINGTSFNGSADITVTANTPTMLTRGTYLTGADFNGGTATTWAVDATDANTPSKIVARDASGNFSAGTVTAALVGNSTTATTLQTARTINGTSFDGSANIIVTANTQTQLTRGTFLTGGDFNGGTATTWTVDATDINTAGKIVARDASGNFSAGTVTAALAGNATTATTLQTARTINGTSFNGSANITVTANTPTTLTRGTYLTGGDFNGGTGTTWAVDATDANTPSKIVARDVSGNFSAGTVTAALAGNATTATTLQTARTINGTSFDGSTNITMTANTPTMLTRGTYLTGGDFNGGTGTTWAVDATDVNTASKIVARDVSGNFSAGTVTAALAGNATTATTLQTARTINGTSFNGSANITVTANTTNALTIGSYLTGTSFNGSAATTIAVDATTADTASKIVARDASGDAFARMYRSTYADQATLGGAMAFRTDSATDNYIRFCSDTAAIRTFLNAPTRTGGDASGTWNINITGTAAGSAGSSSQWTTAGTSIYITGSNVGIGTTAPTSALQVQGTITAPVFNNNWMPPVKKMFTAPTGTYLTVTLGGNTLAKGFYGGFTDGRYAYLVPYDNGVTNHGILTRVDLTNYTTTGVSYLDVSLGGNTRAKGFQGGFTDGRYAYLVPFLTAVGGHNGIFTRVDLNNFTTTGVSYLDVTTAGNTLAKGFMGGFTDGRYAYLVPFYYSSVYHGILTRVDLTSANFSRPIAATATGVAYLDVSTAGNTSAKGFSGGFTDGRYAYLTPWNSGGLVTRVDITNYSTSGVSYLDVSTAGNTLAKGFMGGFTDGRYAYLVPRDSTLGVSHGNFTRINMDNFTTSGVSYLNVSTAGNTNAKGFVGGFTDGRYAYLIPYYGSTFNGIFTRVDLNNYTTSGVSYIDVSTVGNTAARGFQGGFTDGRYAYLVPFFGTAHHGILTRVLINDVFPQGF